MKITHSLTQAINIISNSINTTPYSHWIEIVDVLITAPVVLFDASSMMKYQEDIKAHQKLFSNSKPFQIDNIISLRLFEGGTRYDVTFLKKGYIIKFRKKLDQGSSYCNIVFLKKENAFEVGDYHGQILLSPSDFIELINSLKKMKEVGLQNFL